MKTYNEILSEVDEGAVRKGYTSSGKTMGAKFKKIKQLRKDYKDNESNNRHAENYLMLAKAFGTPDQVKKIRAIIKQRDKDGYMDAKSNKWMYDNINPYYDYLR